MSIKATTDLSSAFAGLDKLAGPLRVSLARSMGVAAGEVFRDTAKALAPIGNQGAEEGISPGPGSLRNAIYLAYREGASTDARVVYAVSWNSKIAPHGHWIEFGHWRVNELVPIGDGGLWIATEQRLDNPVWVPAQPFMRPALEGRRDAAMQAASARARARLPELLAGTSGGAE